MATYPIFDGHNDTVLHLMDKEDAKARSFFEHGEVGHIDLPRAKLGNFAGGFFAMFVRNSAQAEAEMRKAFDVDPNAIPMPPQLELGYAQQMTFKMMRTLFDVEAASEGQVKITRTVDDIEACIANGVLAMILHVEGAGMIDTDLDALEVLYQAGLRSLGIVWSRPNAFAEGVPFKFPHSPDIGDGLTPAGQALVRKCNQLGVMIDLSHLNEKGFWDVAKISDAPLVATHSNVHALSQTPRNLTDKQLAAIKESDGMVGLNFATAFLRADGGKGLTPAERASTPIATMVEHIDYLVDKLGIERVGFGSDFDGAGIPAEIGDVAGLPKLISALEDAGYDDDALNKITHQNWMRVLRQTWKD
ncbi:MAG: dipeptidase [Phototrophicaceae bacterium]